MIKIRLETCCCCSAVWSYEKFYLFFDTNSLTHANIKKSIYTCRYPSKKEIDVLPAAQCFVRVVQTVVRCQLISVSARLV